MILSVKLKQFLLLTTLKVYLKASFLSEKIPLTILVLKVGF